MRLVSYTSWRKFVFSKRSTSLLWGFAFKHTDSTSLIVLSPHDTSWVGGGLREEGPMLDRLKTTHIIEADMLF